MFDELHSSYSIEPKENFDLFYASLEQEGPDQMWMCDKCSQQFFSLINYRKHEFSHTSSNLDLPTYKKGLGTFWDNITKVLKKAVKKEEVSKYYDLMTGFESTSAGVCLRLWGLNNLIVKEALPPTYESAGLELLRMIAPRKYSRSNNRSNAQKAAAGPMRLITDPKEYFKAVMTSKKFFETLRDASEGTFLCAGRAEFAESIFKEGYGKTCYNAREVIAYAGLILEKELETACYEAEIVALKVNNLFFGEEQATQDKGGKKSKTNHAPKGNKPEGDKPTGDTPKEKGNLEVSVGCSEASSSELPSPVNCSISVPVKEGSPMDCSISVPVEEGSPMDCSISVPVEEDSTLQRAASKPVKHDVVFLAPRWKVAHAAGEKRVIVDIPPDTEPSPASGCEVHGAVLGTLQRAASKPVKHDVVFLAPRWKVAHAAGEKRVVVDIPPNTEPSPTSDCGEHGAGEKQVIVDVPPNIEPSPTSDCGEHGAVLADYQLEKDGIYL